jgi:hypothetical protein
MKKVFVLVLALIFSFEVYSQNLIGLSIEQVREIIKKEYPSFDIDNSTVNNSYKYEKYTDRFSEQTLLVFLSDDNKCTATKLMSDYSNLEEVKAKLNKAYKPFGKDKWIYSVKGVTYLVTLKRTDWFFTVFTSKKEK